MVLNKFLTRRILLAPLVGVGLSILYMLNFPLPPPLGTPPTENRSNRDEEEGLTSQTLNLLKTFLDNERLELKDKVSLLETRLSELREENSRLAEEKYPITDSYLEELKKQKALAHSQVADTIARLENSENILRTGDIDLSAEALKSPYIQSIKNAYFALQRREASLSTQLGDRHPELLEVRSEINTIKSQINTEITSLLKAAHQEQEVALAKEKELEHAIEKAQDLTPQANTIQLRMRNLEEELDTLQKQEQRLSEKVKEVVSLGSIPVSSIGLRPLSSGSSNQKVTLGFILFVLTVGFLGGLSLSGLQLLLAGRDEVKTNALKQDLNDVLPIVRAQIPRLSLRSGLGRLKSILGSKDAPFSEVLQSVLEPKTERQHRYSTVISHLARSICHSAEFKDTFMIAVTSYKRESDSSSLALALAVSISRSEHPILLVDLSSRTPSLSSFFPVELTPDQPVILDEKDDLLRITTHEPTSGIYFLPLSLVNISTLTADQIRRLTQGLQKVSSSFDMVLLDVGSLSEEVTASTFARIADEILLLADPKDINGKTPAEIETILGENAPPFSIIENASNIG